MVAKFSNKLALVFIAFVTAISVWADSGSSQSSEPKAQGNGVLNLQVHHPKGKRMPSINVMEVEYYDGVITLSSNYCEGEFSLSFTNTDSGESNMLPSIQVGQSVALELEYGEYEVTAVGCDGTMLAGFMQVY